MLPRYVLPDGIKAVFRGYIVIKPSKRDESRLRTKREKQRFYDLYRRYFTIRRSIIRLRQFTGTHRNLREFPANMFMDRNYSLSSRNLDTSTIPVSSYAAPAFASETKPLSDKIEVTTPQNEVDNVPLLQDNNDFDTGENLLLPPDHDFMKEQIKDTVIGSDDVRRFDETHKSLTDGSVYSWVDGSIDRLAEDSADNFNVIHIDTPENVMQPLKSVPSMPSAPKQSLKHQEQVNLATVSLVLPNTFVEGEKISLNIPEPSYADAHLPSSEKDEMSLHSVPRPPQAHSTNISYGQSPLYV